VAEETGVAQAVRNAYHRAWGEPARTAVFERGGLKIEVFKWTPESSPEGVLLYATLGASDPSITVDSHRVEYMIGLMPERDSIASHLAGKDFGTSTPMLTRRSFARAG
jgi:hypothetical protein